MFFSDSVSKVNGNTNGGRDLLMGGGKYFRITEPFIDAFTHSIIDAFLLQFVLKQNARIIPTAPISIGGTRPPVSRTRGKRKVRQTMNRF